MRLVWPTLRQAGDGVMLTMPWQRTLRERGRERCGREREGERERERERERADKGECSKKKRGKGGKKKERMEEKTKENNNGIDESGSMKSGASNTSRDQLNNSHKG